MTPGVFIGTMIRLLFLCAAPSRVFASRHIQSACRLLVIHILRAVDDVVVAVLARASS